MALGVFLSNLLAMGVPLDDGKRNAKELMKADNTWRLVITLPAILNLFSIIMIYKYHKSPSIINLLGKEDPESERLAIAELKKVYTLKAPMTYELFAKKLRGETFKQADPVGVVEALTSPKYRHSSWNALVLAAANIVSGIIAILTYQTTIFIDMKKKGKMDFPIYWAT